MGISAPSVNGSSGILSPRKIINNRPPTYASLALGSAIPNMANPDGPSRRLMQCHSLLHQDQARRSPDGFRSHGCSSPRLWGHQHHEKGQRVKTTSHLPEKKCKLQSLHYRPRAEIHTLGTRRWCRKAHKALCGVAGLERPSARFKGPLTS